MNNATTDAAFDEDWLRRADLQTVQECLDDAVVALQNLDLEWKKTDPVFYEQSRKIGRARYDLCIRVMQQRGIEPDGYFDY